MKNLLVISPTNPLSSGGIQNLSRILSLYPSDKLCILTRFQNFTSSSASKKYNGEGDSLRYFFYDQKNICGNKTTPCSSAATSDDTKLGSLPLLLGQLRTITKKSSIFRKLIGPFASWTTTLLIILKALQIVKHERVETILGVTDGGPVLFSTLFLGVVKRIPYSILIFDLYKENRLPFYDKFAAYIIEPFLFRWAKHIIVNNEGTKKFYEKRYRNVSLVLIHNSSNPHRYLSLPSFACRDKRQYSIVFTGSIYWAQEQSLQNLISAVKKITDLSIIVYFYTATVANTAFVKKNMGDGVVFDTVSTDRIAEVQSRADILFLPLSWHTGYDDIISTATPGKLTDYLIAGRPILIHAPANSFLVEYARSNDCAAIVDEENPELLISEIKKLLTDNVRVATLTRNAQALFYKNHNLEKNAQKFLSLFA